MNQRGSRPSTSAEGRSVKQSSPSPEKMDALLKRCGIHLAPSQLKRLWAYHTLLRQHDAELNLTRIRNFENMVVKLYADSILPAMHAALPSPLLDLGTGPGMPGIPLKIFRPDLHILLAESRQNRTDFLKMAVAQLKLPGLEVVGRGIAPDYHRPMAGVISRAVEPIADTLARVSACIIQDGMVIFMKGPHCDEEIENASKKFASDYELAEDIPYQVPHTPHHRRLVLFRRSVEPIQAFDTLRNMNMHRTKVIESASNTIFKNLKKLLGGRGVKKQGKTLVCGPRLADEVMERFPERCLAWVSHGDRHPLPSGAPDNLEWYQLAPELYQALDVFGTKKPIVLIENPSLERWQPEEGLLSGCSLLVPFQDPENVGAVVRSAVAFDVNRIILLAESANPFHPKAVRASAGAVFSARLFQGPSLSNIPEDLPVIALTASGRPLSHASFPASFCLLTGMEGPGLPPHWQANALAIPMTPEIESLNAAVATAIALYEWRRASR